MITRQLWTRVAAALAVVALLGGRAIGRRNRFATRGGRSPHVRCRCPRDPCAVLRPGLEYAVDGAREVRLSGPHGASLRALPGTRFSVTSVDAERVAVKLVSGVVSDATATAGYLDVATPAGVLRADRGVVFARVANRNVYVEHQAGSKGSAGLFSPGAPAVGLAAGTFRMMALEAGETMPSKTPVVLPTPPPMPCPRRRRRAPPTGAPQRSRTRPRSPPTAPPAYDPSCGPNPCADPVYVAPAPCAPPPCAPPPTCGGCGEMIRHSGVPVPVRADDTGRSPLTSALGQDACSPDGVCACHCGKIPYVHYVEGLECDVSTYRVGNGLVTVRPASRVRVHRLPDGSLQMWAPNIGRDLALIELNDNQFGYIGDDGFIVINCNGQIEYFRGLVHLYPHRDTPYRDTNPPGDEKNVSEDAIDLPGPKQGSVR